jgi:hypothetical protein
MHDFNFNSIAFLQALKVLPVKAAPVKEDLFPINFEI